MNEHKMRWIALLAVLAILAGASPAWAGAVKSPFEGSMSLASLVDPGTCIYPGGMEICRDLTVVFASDASDDRFDGSATTVIHSNFHLEPYGGQQWGTMELVNAGGSWKGTWTGVRNEDGSAYLRAVAHGQGGYEGLQVRLEAVRLSPDMFEPFAVTGYILDPHGD
jgi:hypothetical protein